MCARRTSLQRRLHLIGQARACLLCCACLLMPHPDVNGTVSCLSKVELFPRRNVAPLFARYAVVEGRSVSPKECVGPFVLHTVVEGRNVFPKESTRCDLSKVEWFSRRNVLGSKKVGGTGSVEGRIISPKECNSPINIRMGDYVQLGPGTVV